MQGKFHMKAHSDNIYGHVHAQSKTSESIFKCDRDVLSLDGFDFPVCKLQQLAY